MVCWLYCSVGTLGAKAYHNHLQLHLLMFRVFGDCLERRFFSMWLACNNSSAFFLFFSIFGLHQDFEEWLNWILFYSGELCYISPVRPNRSFFTSLKLGVYAHPRCWHCLHGGRRWHLWVSIDYAFGRSSQETYPASITFSLRRDWNFWSVLLSHCGTSTSASLTVLLSPRDAVFIGETTASIPEPTSEVSFKNRCQLSRTNRKWARFHIVACGQAHPTVNELLSAVFSGTTSVLEDVSLLGPSLGLSNHGDDWICCSATVTTTAVAQHPLSYRLLRSCGISSPKVCQNFSSSVSA